MQDEDMEPVGALLTRNELYALQGKIVKARQALAAVRVMEEGQWFDNPDRRALDAADRALLRVLRDIREEVAL